MTKPTTLTTEEKAVIKALLAEGMRNQDILTLINHEREATINFGRITGVKKNTSIAPASPEEVAFFKRKKRSFDPITGLNLYSDERLIRARETIIWAPRIVRRNLSNNDGQTIRLAVSVSSSNVMNMTPLAEPGFCRTSTRPETEMRLPSLAALIAEHGEMSRFVSSSRRKARG